MMLPHPPAELTVPIELVSTTTAARNQWRLDLADCESGASTTIKHIDTNGKYSYGKYQYQMATWLSFAFLGTTPENIYDGNLQDRVTTYALDHGGIGNWVNCGEKNVQLKLGSWPLL